MLESYNYPQFKRLMGLESFLTTARTPKAVTPSHNAAERIKLCQRRRRSPVCTFDCKPLTF